MSLTINIAKSIYYSKCAVTRLCARRGHHRLIVFGIFVIVLLFIKLGPEISTNFVNELTDIKVGRMTPYEPIVKKLSPHDWSDPTSRALWRKCTENSATCKITSDHRSRYTGIPKIIHQMYKDDNIPEIYGEYIQTWIQYHPKFEYWFWTDEDILLLIKDFYPSYVDLYNSYHFGIQKSDIARYFILHRFGGVYMDLDYESLGALDSYLANYTTILTQEPREQSLLIYGKETVITNAFMASIPNHPLFLTAIQTLETAKLWTWRKRGNYLLYFDSRWTIYLTGPMLLTRVFEQYKDWDCCQKVADFRASLLPVEKFSPLPDMDKIAFFKSVCASLDNLMTAHDILLKLKKVCNELKSRNFEARIPPDAVARHHWLHLGYRSNRMKTVSISSIVKGMTVNRYMTLRRS